MNDDSKFDWVVRIAQPETYGSGPTLRFDDEGPWVQLLGFGWANIDTQGISIRPRKGQVFGREPYNHATAQWTMAIHLLGLGLGWNDIGLGLRRWREERYQLGYHAILDFLWANFGEDIEALEIYFGFMPRNLILESLERIRQSKNRPEFEFEPKPSTSLEEEYELRRQNWLRKSEHSNFSISRLMLNGNDPLHLEDHCAASFVEDGWDLMGSQISRNYSGAVTVSTPYYKGWAHRLAMFNDQHKELNEEHGEVLVEVHLIGIGSLGKYVWNETSQRWWRTNRDALSINRELDAHLWGHKSKTD